jgi:hypothetical protein
VARLRRRKLPSHLDGSDEGALADVHEVNRGERDNDLPVENEAGIEEAIEHIDECRLLIEGLCVSDGR